MTKYDFFRHRLPESRLGQAHKSLESFFRAVSSHKFRPTSTKAFAIIVVTASPRHILLGLKNRGFGKSMFNFFGGKFDPGESPEVCASRELKEESNIHIPAMSMRNSKVGIVRYTFEEDPMEMVMHLYRINMPRKDCPAFADIRPCEEITPKWFDDWREIPLNNMFADDSHWLPVVLATRTDEGPLEVDGRFHFQKNCQETNTILHYFMDVKNKSNMGLIEQRSVDGLENVEEEDEKKEEGGGNFRHRLPATRLGQSHATMDSFQQASSNHGYNPTQTKEFTLVVVTASPRSILLSLKNLEFGKAFYNSFGGKFDPDEESPEECASREVLEETNICVTPTTMRDSKVGILRFTSEEDPVEMVIHTYRIHMPRKDCPAYSDIRGGEEMTPSWLEDWREIPLGNMLAADSHWLVPLLKSTDRPLEINGSFHFQRNPQRTNTILHYHMHMKEKPRFTLEKRLFHAIHDNKVHSPSIKEFKECFAFQNVVTSALKRKGQDGLDVVIDVAGGHGALAALFLTFTTAVKAVVVDPTIVGNGGVERAWKRDFFSKKKLVYRPECLRTGLPAELKDALQTTRPERILVVACHACQHLSEETLEIACRYGVHVAVMPCCQKDQSEGSSWKAVSKNLSMPFGPTMDLLLAGKMLASKKHDVRMKVIDSKITPQNRVIICRALSGDTMGSSRSSDVDEAHDKLRRAYLRAHDANVSQKREKRMIFDGRQSITPAFYLGVGFLAGALFATASPGKR